MREIIIFILSTTALAASILSQKQPLRRRLAALAGFLLTAFLVRWLLRTGDAGLQHILIGCFTLALAAACWVDRKRGRASVGLLACLTLLFGLLPLAGVIRLLVLEPEQFSYLKDSFLTCLLCLPAGISAGLCLPAALRRRK